MGNHDFWIKMKKKSVFNYLSLDSILHVNTIILCLYTLNFLGMKLVYESREDCTYFYSQWSFELFIISEDHVTNSNIFLVFESWR
jgi:hypothetical protein